jgi:cellulose synthase/poly-beta-1,6-N-acetylglucosamine synthase-like glycosyltransferase
MATLISGSLALVALLLAVLVAIFFIEVIGATTLMSRDCLLPSSGDSRRRVAVLVPAHNESTGLLPTLADIKAQLRPSDRLLVVADNCTDDTSAVAAAAGADVIERNDLDKKGKGYALALGVRRLTVDPPDIVIVIDADCRLAVAAINKLEAACSMSQRPVQALYLMLAPEGSPINYRVAEFAWRVKNWVRPLGLKALGLPCQLMGTGMAFPWNLIRSADLGSESIVEDMKLGLDLALLGSPPVFCCFLGVTSVFPTSSAAIQTQRLRWERGHVGIILTAVPRLIVAAILRADFDLLALALDVAVPPLSLLGMLVIGMSVVSGLMTWLGFSSVPMFVSAATLAGFLGAVFLSWLKFGREILPPGAMMSIPTYVVGKLPLYCRALFSKAGAHWTRTDRK